MVIIDEMSMVDIQLFQALLKAVAPGTRLVLPLAPVGGIQVSLQDAVQGLAAQRALSHGGEHLDVEGRGLHIPGQLLPAWGRDRCCGTSSAAGAFPWWS